MRTLLDNLMEKTVVPSFSSLGSNIRGRLFNWTPLTQYSLQGKVVVLTGGTSGIGLAGAYLYASLGATLVLLGRDQDKTTRVVSEIQRQSGHQDIVPLIGDLGDSSDVRRLAEEIAARYSRIDVLVHNAGALYNERRRASNGVDLTVELMVATPFLLTGLLLENLGALDDKAQSSAQSPSRVITMSSGGMYTEPLNVATLQMSDSRYQGAQQYARAKRAQVTLNELWADRISAQRVVFHALHPGWVDTPGIKDALPGFSRLLGPLRLLRSPEHGADTMVWLSADDTALQSSGKFWHDRETRSTHMSAKTRTADTAEQRQALWDWCESHTEWSLGSR